MGPIRAFRDTWRFRKAVITTLTLMHAEGFSGDGDPQLIADECLKRLMTPSADILADVEAATGSATPGGPFLDILAKLFNQMVESSLLLKIILSLFGL